MSRARSHIVAVGGSQQSEKINKAGGTNVSCLFANFLSYYEPAMKHLPLHFLLFPLALIVAGCLATPVERTGGMGSVTATNTNLQAVAAAAQSIFPNYGYTQGPANFPDWIAFDKRAGLFGQAMWGSYGEPQTLRVRVTMRQVPGSGDIRLVPSVFTVTSAGEAGFEDARPLMGLWSGEFGPILRQISAQASGAGPGL